MLKHLLRGGGSSINGDPWVITIVGRDDDVGESVAVAPDGSVYIGGYTTSAGAGSYDAFLAKFSSSGTVQWQRTLGGSGYDNTSCVAVAPDGSVYVCGGAQSAGVGGSDCLLAKFSSSGTVQWQRTLGGKRDETSNSVAVAPDGSVYIGGQTQSAGAGKGDLLLAKFSSAGTLQWQRTLGGSSGNDYAISVAVAPDGSVYTCGGTQSAGAGNSDFFITKFSSSGTVQWYKTLGGSGTDTGYSVAVAPDGSVYVYGYTTSAGAGSYDAFLAKFSSSGTVQWQRTLGGRDLEHGYSVAVASDGSVYVCGYTKSSETGNQNLPLIAKFSSSGTVQWQKTLGGNVFDGAQSIAVAPDGSVYVCGFTESLSVGGRHFLLAKITDSLIEKGVGTFGIFTFRDVSLTAKNVSLTITSPGFSVSDAGLTVTTPSLIVGTPSFDITLYPYTE